MDNKILIGKKAKVNIKWEVSPIDYTKEAEESIRLKVAKKYDISKDNVRVEPIFSKTNVNGIEFGYDNTITKSIQDPKFQQILFKQYLSEKNITDYDFDDLLKIDNYINSKINYELYDSNRQYTIKWVRWSNFMSYGENNYIDLTTLNGLVLLTSEPANQGGKSTFCLDLFRFLLFGKVASRESDWTMANAFNNHLPEATEVVVEGCINIDGEDYVIKRTLKRPQLSKRTEKSKVTNKVNYYKVVSDGTLSELEEENQEESSSTMTNKAIKDAIGNERDFDLMICVNSDNLKSLISLKDTERGRLISRWIGLLPLEEKDKISRETYNKVFIPSLLSNKYNKEQILDNIETLKSEIDDYKKQCESLTKRINENKKSLEEDNKTKETLLESKIQIDDNLLKIDVTTIEAQMEQIKNSGKIKRNEKLNTDNSLKILSTKEFDEDKYREKVSKKESLISEVAILRERLKMLKKSTESLKNSEYCPTCGAKLKNVDNSKAIQEKEKEYDETLKQGIAKKGELDELVAEITLLENDRKEYNERLRLQLLSDKLSVDIDNLLAKYAEKKRLHDDISKNIEAISKNSKIDASLNVVNTNIATKTQLINNDNNELSYVNANIKNNEKSISENQKIIEIINKEEKKIRDWKIYLEMIGKNGISKLVVRNTLPLINGELKRILTDVCDFDVEVIIDDHNDVAFNIIHDNVVSNLASGSGFEQTVASLALRSVLSKISIFSKPSFVVFDEILGGVSDENYDNVKLLYDKIKNDYKTILQISHLKQIADWHDKRIVIKKENNISKIISE